MKVAWPGYPASLLKDQIMATRFAALLLATALLPLSGPALAGAGQEELAAQGSFSEDTTRTMVDGRVFKRHVEQKAVADGFSRKEVLTAPDGRSASYTLSRHFDAASQRWMRSEEGTGFDGRQWSRTEQGEPELPVFGDMARPPVAQAAPASAAETPAGPAKAAGPKRREFR